MAPERAWYQEEFRVGWRRACGPGGETGNSFPVTLHRSVISQSLSFPITGNLCSVASGQIRILASGAALDPAVSTRASTQRQQRQKGTPLVAGWVRTWGPSTPCKPEGHSALGAEGGLTPHQGRPPPSRTHRLSPSMLDDSIMLVSRSISRAGQRSRW